MKRDVKIACGKKNVFACRERLYSIFCGEKNVSFIVCGEKDVFCLLIEFPVEGNMWLCICGEKELWNNTL